jgi:hypothetical protein
MEIAAARVFASVVADAEKASSFDEAFSVLPS